MRVDGLIGDDLTEAAHEATVAEDVGYDGVWSAETKHDPFLPLAIAAEHSSRLELGTAIAVAFGRSPMTVAQTAWDLHTYSEGRFLLGLGSQIKTHIERRYSMPWSQPTARMREFISALHAIWACWQEGTRLDFDGDFYTHNLMTPFFSPGPSSFGHPKVFLAAVGDSMTRVAGAVADGMLVHGFTTERYLREMTLPAIEVGLESSGRRRGDFQLMYPALVVTGHDESQLAEADAATRQQIAFYASTPAYRAVLELHGWGELQTELGALSKTGEWDQMGKLIDDDMLDAFAVRAEVDNVPAELLRRFDGLVDRLRIYAPGGEGAVTDQVTTELARLARVSS